MKDPARNAPALRALQRAILRLQDDIGRFADENQATLDLLALTPVEEGEGMMDVVGEGDGGGPL